jgi:hypothetical protein
MAAREVVVPRIQVVARRSVGVVVARRAVG